MKIDGKKLAEKVLQNVRTQLASLPPVTLAIVTLGPEDSWEHYVSQKIKLAAKLGIEARLINLKDPTEEKLISTIEQLNNDTSVTGIIVQRPLTRHIAGDKITYAVSSEKDIDGFIKSAHFEPPVWLAVEDILREIFNLDRVRPFSGSDPQVEFRGFTPGVEARKFAVWLKSQRITVLGKGETAGQPIIDGLQGLGVKPLIIDSETQNVKEVLKNADIIISAVGKRGIFEIKDLKEEVIIIGIGLHREDEKLKPDFDEEEISKIAKYYSPTPGGVGPLNLAYLFKNLVKAAQFEK